MANLIEELKKEHEEMVNVLGEVSKLGMVSKEAQKRLMDAKSRILFHLTKEDEKFYPVLKKAAEKDEGLKNIVDDFVNDMNEISKSVMEFFNKYSDGKGGIEFARDVGMLLATLKIRIRKEENILYREYEKRNL